MKETVNSVIDTMELGSTLYRSEQIDLYPFVSQSFLRASLP